jgi:allophanate hydrolase
MSHPEAMDPIVKEIMESANIQNGAEVFLAQDHMAKLKRQADRVWNDIDVMLLPTAPDHFTVEQISAAPLTLNARLGKFTNFVNLLDYCAVAVPAGFLPNGLPFGVTLISMAGSDRALSILADRLQRSLPSGAGIFHNAPLPGTPMTTELPSDRIKLFVVGAHLSEMPLNHELVALGGAFVGEARTVSGYRFFVLPNTTPPKPGLVYAPGPASGQIAGEIWSLSVEAFGKVVAGIPAPLGIGKVHLESGDAVCGFLCEAYATEGARDITSLGGWRRYIGESQCDVGNH